MLARQTLTSHSVVYKRNSSPGASKLSAHLPCRFTASGAQTPSCSPQVIEKLLADGIKAFEEAASGKPTDVKVQIVLE